MRTNIYGVKVAGWCLALMTLFYSAWGYAQTPTSIEVREVSWTGPAGFAVVVTPSPEIAETVHDVRLEIGLVGDGVEEDAINLTARLQDDGSWRARAALPGAGRIDGLAVLAAIYDEAGSEVESLTEYFPRDNRPPQIADIRITDRGSDANGRRVGVEVRARDDSPLGGARIRLTVVDQGDLNRASGAIDAVRDKLFLGETVVYPDKATGERFEAVFVVSGADDERWSRSLRLAEINVWDWSGNAAYAYDHGQLYGSTPESCRVEPGSLALGFPDRRQLHVYTTYVVAGARVEYETTFDQGTTYTSASTNVAYVTERGVVSSRPLSEGNPNETTISVHCEGIADSQEIPVLVTETNVNIDEVCIATEVETSACLSEEALWLLNGVGSSGKLYLIGKFSIGEGDVFALDLSDQAHWTAAPTALASVDGLGRVAGLSAGSGTVSAVYEGNPALADSVSVQVVDMPPQVSLNAPRSVRIDEDLVLTATARDDVGVVEVAYFLNDDSIGSANRPPFRTTFRLAARYIGQRVKISAQASDGALNRSALSEREVEILPPEEESFTVETRVPQAADRLKVGAWAPFQVRVVSDQALDEQISTYVNKVDFLIDGVVVQRASYPSIIIEQEIDPLTGQQTDVPVVVWQGSWRVPQRYAPNDGDTKIVVFQAVAHLYNGDEVRGSTVSIRIEADDAPIVRLLNPFANASGPLYYPAKAPIAISADVSDDLLGLGVLATLMVSVDGGQNFMPYQALEVGRASGSDPWSGTFAGYDMGGHAQVSFSYTLPAEEDQHIDFYVEVRDSSGQQTITSPPVTLITQPNQAPLVSIVRPLDLSEVLASKAVYVETLAHDDVGVDRIEFHYRTMWDDLPTDWTLLRVLNSPPYEFYWTIPALAPGARIQLRATAVAQTDESAEDTIELAVTEDTTDPHLSILVPSEEDERERKWHRGSNKLVIVAGFDDLRVRSVSLHLNHETIKTFSENELLRKDPDDGSFYVSWIMGGEFYSIVDGLESAELVAYATDFNNNTGASHPVILDIEGDPEYSIVNVEGVVDTPFDRDMLVHVDTEKWENIRHVDAAVQYCPSGCSGDCVPDAGLCDTPESWITIADGSRYFEPFDFALHLDSPAGVDLSKSYAGRVIVTAVGIDGNEAGFPPVSFILPADRMDPNLAIVSPYSNANMRLGERFIFKAAASDDIGIDDVIFHFAYPPDREATFSLSADNGVVRMQGGFGLYALDIPVGQIDGGSILTTDNSILCTLRVTARDAAGNSTDREVFFNVDPDSSPEVTILYPPEYSLYMEGDLIKVEALVVDDGTVQSVTARTDPDTSEFDAFFPPPFTDGPIQTSVRAPRQQDGVEDRLTVTAIDTRGQTGSASRLLSITKDPEPPTFERLIPQQGKLTAAVNGRIFLHYKTWDNVWVRKVRLNVSGTSVAGELVLDRSTEKTQRITMPDPNSVGEILLRTLYSAEFKGAFPESGFNLDPGEYKLVVAVEDGGGNIVDETLDLILEKPAPVFSWKLPASAEEESTVAVGVRVKTYDKLSRLTLTADAIDCRCEASPTQGQTTTSLECRNDCLIPTRQIAGGEVRCVAEATTVNGETFTSVRTLRVDANVAPLVTLRTPESEELLFNAMRYPFAADIQENGDLTFSAFALSEWPLEAFASVEDGGGALEALFDVQPSGAYCMRGWDLLSSDAETILGIRLDAADAPLALILSEKLGDLDSLGPLTVQPDLGGEGDCPATPPAQALQVSYDYTANGLSISRINLKVDEAYPFLVEEMSIDLASEPYRVSLLRREEGVLRPAVEIQGVASGTYDAARRGSLSAIMAAPDDYCPDGESDREAYAHVLVADRASLAAFDSHSVFVGVDLDLPRVEILEPNSSDFVGTGATVKVRFRASDNAALAEVRLLMNSQEIFYENVFDPKAVLGDGMTFSDTFIVPDGIRQVALVAEAIDQAGFRAVSAPVVLEVMENAAPAVAFDGLYSDAIGKVICGSEELLEDRGEVTRGERYRLILHVTDDVGVARLDVAVNGSELTSIELSGSRSWTGEVPFLVNPEFETIGFVARATDLAGAVTERSLYLRIVEQESPRIGVVLPRSCQQLQEGTVKAHFKVLACDPNTYPARAELFLNGSRLTAQAQELEFPMDGEIFLDSDFQEAVKEIREPWYVEASADPFAHFFEHGLAECRYYGEVVDIPAGYSNLESTPTCVCSDLGPCSTELTFTSLIYDTSETFSRRETVVKIIEDLSDPEIVLTHPDFGTAAPHLALKELQYVRLGFHAKDNAFIDRVEAQRYCLNDLGGEVHPLQWVTETYSSFPAVDFCPTDTVGICTPTLNYNFALPSLDDLNLMGCADDNQVFVEISAYDHNGNFASTVVSIDVDLDAGPILVVNSPTDNQVVVAGSWLPIDLTVSDDVAVVEARACRSDIYSTCQFSGEEGVVVSREYPFSLLFKVPDLCELASCSPEPPVEPVPFSLRVEVLDSYAGSSEGSGGGSHIASETVYLEVKANDPPLVSIASPRNGASIYEGQSLPVHVSAVDDNVVKIVGLEYDIGGVGCAHPDSGNRVTLTEPYVFALSIPGRSDGCALTLRAWAQDDLGVRSYAPTVLVNIAQDDEAPYISLSDGRGDDILTELPCGDRLYLGASVHDNVRVSTVAFYLFEGDFGPIGQLILPDLIANGFKQIGQTMFEGPYLLDYTIPTTNCDGKLTLIAAAMDPAENIGLSGSVLITLQSNQPPTIELYTDNEGRDLLATERRLRLAAQAKDEENGLETIALYFQKAPFTGTPEQAVCPELEPAEVDDLVVRREATALTYEFVADESLLNQCIYFVAAATDNVPRLHPTYSSPVAFKVVLNADPLISLLKPEQGALVSVGSPLDFSARAKDDIAISRVEFWVNDRPVRTVTEPSADDDEIYTTSYLFPVGTEQFVNEVRARAFDSTGKYAWSESVTVTAISDEVPPRVEIRQPIAGSVATAGDFMRVEVVVEDDAQAVNADLTMAKLADSDLPYTNLGLVERTGSKAVFAFLVSVADKVDGLETAGQEVFLKASGVDYSGNLGESEEVSVLVGLRPEYKIFDKDCSQTSGHRPLRAARAVSWSGGDDNNGFLFVGETSKMDAPLISSQDPYPLLPSNGNPGGRVAYYRPDDYFGSPCPKAEGSVEVDGTPVAIAMHGDQPVVLTMGYRTPNGLEAPGKLYILPQLPQGDPIGYAELAHMEAYGLQVVGEVAIVGAGEGGLRVYSLINQATPQLIDHVLESSARDVWLDRRDNVILAAEANIKRYSTLGPGLEALSTIDTSATAHALTGEDQLLIVSNLGRSDVAAGGVRVFDAYEEPPIVLYDLGTASRRPDRVSLGTLDAAVIGSRTAAVSNTLTQDAAAAEGYLQIFTTIPGYSSNPQFAAPIIDLWAVLPSQGTGIDSGNGMLYVAANRDGVYAFDIGRFFVKRTTPPRGETNVAVNLSTVDVIFSEAVKPDQALGTLVKLYRNSPNVLNPDCEPVDAADVT
ncbi:MAG: hypothetical protein C4523_07820, partial [Myxococcales bacterium]